MTLDRSKEKEQCLRCDAYEGVYKEDLKFSARVSGEITYYSAPGWLCRNCGNIWSTAAEEEEHDRLSAEAYRKAHGLLTAMELEARRNKLGLGKSAFTSLLGVPRVTYDRWLKGVIQGDAMDQALRAVLDERAAVINNLRLLAERFAELKEEFRGSARPNLHALYNMIRYFVQKRGETKKEEIGELYLNKLCWYADQAAFNERGQSISGWPYLSMQFGPVLSAYDQIFRAMVLAGYVKQVKSHNFELGEQAGELHALEESDKQYLSKVWKKFGGNLKGLVKNSHDEKGWKDTKPLEEIDFNLSRKLKNL